MAAQVIRTFGDPNVFQTADIATPALRAGHVLIRVAATSVNPADTKIRRSGAGAPDVPAVLHGDVAGTVVAVADDVDRFRVGDAVYGCAGGVRGSGGALADFMLADARLVARMPRNLTFAQAAALPLVTITAWDGLIDRARVNNRDSVLVFGATGGVGHIAVQLAKAAGATVYAVVSSEEKAAVARDLGADIIIDRRQHTITGIIEQHTRGRGFDVVVDTVGGSVLEASLHAAALNGRVVSIMAKTATDLAPMHAKNLTLHAVMMLVPLLHGVGRERHGEMLEQAASMVESGHLRPLLDARQFTFEQVADAHALVESGTAIGKVVLTRTPHTPAAHALD